jgi:CO/xanthine dehydrogenase Mo-binding subunit
LPASEDAGAHGADAPAAEAAMRKTGNISEHVHYAWGDVAAGFGEADAVVERTFTTSAVHQSYLETQSCMVQPDPLTGGATVWTSTQAFHAERWRSENPETDAPGTPLAAASQQFAI